MGKVTWIWEKETDLLNRWERGCKKECSALWLEGYGGEGKSVSESTGTKSVGFRFYLTYLV